MVSSKRLGISGESMNHLMTAPSRIVQFEKSLQEVCE